MPSKYTAPSPALAGSSEIEARITSERGRLLDEQNIEHDLGKQRTAPLEAGDDEALDRIEAQLNACRDRQFRIQERIEILEVRHAEAIARENDAQLDALADRANRARERGERLIRNEYAKHATALAGILMDLAAINEYIASANAKFAATGREHIAKPNQIRCSPHIEWDEPAKINVHVNDPRHPHHGRALISYCNPDRATLTDGTDRQIPVSTEICTTERKDFGPIFKKDLTEMVVLPEIEQDEPGQGRRPLWDEDFVIRRRAEIRARMEEIEASLLHEVGTESARNAASRSRTSAKSGEPA